MLKFAFLSQAWPEDDNINISGSSVQVYFIAKELAKRGYPVLVILTAHSGYEYVQGKLQVCSIQTSLKLRNQLSKKWLNNIVDILNNFQPDIVYQRGKLPESVAVSIYKQRTNTCFIWLSNSDNSGENWKYVKKRWNKRDQYQLSILPRLIEALYADSKIEKAIKLSDIVIAQTKHQQITIKNNFHMDSILLGSGHPIPKFKKKLIDKKVTILWLANLTPVKQPHLFAELAFKLQHLNADFIMAGKPLSLELLNKVKKITLSMPNFHYVGGVGLNKCNQLLQNTDIFVCTSQYEGLPNTFIQAFKHGIPVLSLKNDPDNIIRDHNLGAVSKNKKELAHQVIKFVQNQTLRQQTSQIVYDYAQKYYNIETIVDQLLDIIRKQNYESV